MYHGGVYSIGYTVNSRVIASPTESELSLTRFSPLVGRLASVQAIQEGVKHLHEIERMAWDPVVRLQRGFDILSTRIELGHRIEGTCSEVGY